MAIKQLYKGLLIIHHHVYTILLNPQFSLSNLNPFLSPCYSIENHHQHTQIRNTLNSDIRSAMKILNGNTLYEFTVTKIDSTVEINDLINLSFRYRKLQSPSTQELEDNRSIQCDRRNSAVMTSFVTDMLVYFSVPEQTRIDMATHFRFYIDRIVLRRRCSVMSVLVSLDAKEVSPEMVAAIGRRRERERGRVAAVVETTAVAVGVPAKKAVVERLERERVVVVEEERECAICLEVFGGEEKGKGNGIELPCLHVYHKECIIEWLGRNHFCPFCRFKLVDE